jgi:Zn-finger nucleic acid-binding protein
LFLDEGQLNRVAEPTDGDLEFSTVDLDSFDHPDAYGRADCPRCRGAVMMKVEFVIFTNIILDYCGRCRGFWLDGKELERINGEVRTLNAASRGAPVPPMIWFAYFIWSLPR